jgi:O-antigen ligase
MRLHQSNIIRPKHGISPIAGKRNERRKLQVPVFHRIYVLLTSPAGALLFSILGYYAFAGISNAFTPDANVGSISIWVLLTAIAFMAFREGKYAYSRKIYIYFVPAIIFFVFYIYRILENNFNLGMNIDPSPQITLLFLFGGSIFPAFIHASIAGGIRDDQLIKVTLLLCFIFLISIGLNIDELLVTIDNRMQLQKINPISLAYQSLWLIVLLIFYMRRSWKFTTISLILIPMLSFVLLNAKSRGPFVSVIGALAFYFILLPGKSRIRVLWGSLLIFVFIALFMGSAMFDILAHLIDSVDLVEDQSTALHLWAAQGAWNQFLDNPFFGRYLIELNTQFYPHNIYLEALMSVGFIGALPFYWHLCLSVRAAAGLVRMHNQITAVKVLCFLFFGHCIAAGISGSIWGTAGFWILSFVLIALWYRPPEHTIAQTLKEK